MTSSVAEAGSPRRSRPRWVLLGVGVAVAAMLGLVINDRMADARSQDARDAAEPTAWENRAAMDRVLVDAARVMGIDPEVQPQREAPLTCMRHDGRQGVSYFLHDVGDDDPLDDPQRALEEVAQVWRDAGYAVSDVRGVDELWRLTAETPEGAPIAVLTGPGGTSVYGETGCFLRDGAPNES